MFSLDVMLTVDYFAVLFGLSDPWLHRNETSVCRYGTWESLWSLQVATLKMGLMK